MSSSFRSAFRDEGSQAIRFHQNKPHHSESSPPSEDRRRLPRLWRKESLFGQSVLPQIVAAALLSVFQDLLSPPQTKSPHKTLRRHRVIPLQGLPNHFRRNCPFPPNTPKIPAQLDNRRGQTSRRSSAIQNQRNPVPQLSKNFISTLARRRPRKIRAGPRQRYSQLRDQIINNFIFRPAQSHPPRIRRHLQRQPVRCIHHNRQRPRPASLRQPVKIVRQFLCQHLRINQGIDQDGQGAMFRTPFHAKDFFYGRQIDGIGCQRIQGIRGHSNHRTTV